MHCLLASVAPASLLAMKRVPDAPEGGPVTLYSRLYWFPSAYTPGERFPVFSVPREAQDFIKNFDDGEPVEPITFTVTEQEE